MQTDPMPIVNTSALLAHAQSAEDPVLAPTAGGHHLLMDQPPPLSLPAVRGAQSARIMASCPREIRSVVMHLPPSLGGVHPIDCVTGATDAQIIEDIANRVIARALVQEFRKQETCGDSVIGTAAHIAAHAAQWAAMEGDGARKWAERRDAWMAVCGAYGA